MNAPGPKAALPKSGRCPVCGAPADPASRPFCSPRCKAVDLNRWLKGGYSIPVVEHGDIAEEEIDRLPKSGD